MITTLKANRQGTFTCKTVTRTITTKKGDRTETVHHLTIDDNDTQALLDAVDFIHALVMARDPETYKGLDFLLCSQGKPLNIDLLTRPSARKRA
jgi:hypothetical protein